MRRKIVIMHRTITSHDAIGNDVEGMYNILKEKNICKCYAEFRLNKNLEYIEENEVKKLIQDNNAVVIYHHSIYWEKGEELIAEAKANLVFRYHNITPGEYFKSYNQGYYKSCEEGRKQTKRLIQEYPKALWLSASKFNSKDLGAVPLEQISICPPLHKIDSWINTLPDEKVLEKLLNSPKLNILFVGRVAPNKGHMTLINIINAFCCNVHRNIKLHVIGKFDEGLASYNKMIKDRINYYGIQDNIEFVGEINDAILISYYLGSDIFLCVSEHEGFCVPLIEAQKLELPIIAKESSVISETLGENQLILTEDLIEYVAAISLIGDRLEYRRYLRKEGTTNYDTRFTYEVIQNNLARIMLSKLEVDV